LWANHVYKALRARFSFVRRKLPLTAVYANASQKGGLVIDPLIEGAIGAPV
jgi:hypothetical protein